MDDKDTIVSLKLLLHKESKEIDMRVKKDQTMIDVLREANLPLDGILIFDNGKPIPLDSKASEFKVLTIVNVSSGG